MLPKIKPTAKLLCFLFTIILLQFSKAGAQQIEIIDGNGGSASSVIPGYRTLSGSLKLGDEIGVTTTNVFIGRNLTLGGFNNTFTNRIGSGRQFSLQVERGNISHLLRAPSTSPTTTAFGTSTEDIWSTVGLNLTGTTNFYGYSGMFGGNGMFFGLQSGSAMNVNTGTGAITTVPSGAKNVLIGWSKSSEGTENRLKFSYFNGSSESERMTILSTGQVGIGTSSPAFRLQVNANVSGTGAEGQTGNGPVIANFNNPTSSFSAGAFESYITVSGAGGNAQLGVNDQGDVYIGSRLNNVVGSGNGKLKFTIGNNTVKATISDAGFNIYSSANIANDLFMGATNYRWGVFSRDWANGDAMIFVPEDATYPQGWNWDRAFTLHRTGDFVATVEGKFGAREIEVKMGTWNDAVFHPEYQLRSLEEVEAYVKANNHLPEIPSEKEVITEGVNVGEMLSAQMKKIEELYLYTIELNKEIEQLKLDNQALKKAIKKGN